MHRSQFNSSLYDVLQLHLRTESSARFTELYAKHTTQCCLVNADSGNV